MQLLERVLHNDGGEERALRLIKAEIEDLDDNLALDNIETARWHAHRLASYLDTLAAHQAGDNLQERASARMHEIINNLRNAQ